jgi:hypothetical protein
MSGLKYMRNKCLQDGCDQQVLHKTGFCIKHRRSKCKKIGCGKFFMPSVIGDRICPICKYRNQRNVNASPLFSEKEFWGR